MANQIAMEVTWVEHTVIGGVLQQPGFTTTATGTYDVDADCTGTAIVDTPTSPVPLHLGLVILKQGNEVHTVLDTHAITTVFTKVD
jgi:glyoxylase-like metal-dependent hydrolase (beta-lactamase superfamily II)